MMNPEKEKRIYEMLDNIYGALDDTRKSEFVEVMRALYWDAWRRPLNQWLKRMKEYD